MKRPLGLVALLYGGGLLLAEFCQPPLLVLFAVSLSLAVTALLLPRVRHVLLGPLIVGAAWTNLVSHTAVVSPNDLRKTLSDAPALAAVRGTLCETPSQRIYVRDEQESSRSLAFLDVREIRRGAGWQPACGRIVVITPGVLPAGFFSGSKVEISGILAAPPLPVAEGLFDYRAYLRRQGIYFQLRAGSTNEWQNLEPRKTAPVADRFLAWAQATLARGLPEADEPLRLLWAMTLGWRAGITNEVYEPFMQSGTMHIFAISGLHIALIAGILVAVLRVAQVSRFWCGAIIVPLIWFYTAATGWQPSAIRSTIMMSIIICGWALQRPTDLLNSLGAAAFIILLWDPQQLFQASFQLSFFVVLSIALFLPPLEKIRSRLFQSDPLLPVELIPRWKRLVSAPLRVLTTCLVTSLAAWLGSWPLTAYYFHLFSPVTLLANLVIVPASSAALACNLGSLICGSWLPLATELFNFSGWAWMWLMVHVSHWATELPGAFFFVPSPRLADFVIYYGALIAVLSNVAFRPKWRVWALVAIPCVAVFYFWRWQTAREQVCLSVIPLSGGSSTFFRVPGRANDSLMDCGNANAVESVMKPFLRAQGMNHLPQLILTQGDLRRVGGTETLRTLMPVNQVVTPSARFRSPAYQRIIEQLSQTPSRWRSVKRGDSIGPWTVLHPDPADRFPQADDNSLVLLGRFQGVRVLLLSDLGRPGQNALLERIQDLRADIVVTGLPEQTEPLGEALLNAIQPRVIIVADSEFPATKRANAKLRARLEARKVPLLYTRQTGSATITLRAGRWEVKTISGARLSGESSAAKQPSD